MYRNQECYADPTAGEALARIAREEQLHAQVKRIREIKYKLAWTNPAFLCSALQQYEEKQDAVGTFFFSRWFSVLSDLDGYDLLDRLQREAM